MAKTKYIKGLMHHRFRFGLKGNFKVLLCRIFGHEKNNNRDHGWCERCGLCDTEIYNKQWAEDFKNEELKLNGKR